MMKYALGAVALAIAVPATAASTFNGSYVVTANSPGNSGLEIVTENLADPFNFTLNLNQSVTFDLFRIWTNETNVNGDDKIDSPIKVDFSFTTPTGPGGAVTGSTSGGISLFIFQYGELDWANNGVQTFNFSNNNVLKVKLNDVTYNDGWFALKPGREHGANVSATFTLTAVPEPATWAMMIGGFALAGAAIRRRNNAQVTFA